MAESSKNTMKLLIISKSSYSAEPRWCYLAIDRSNDRIYRPIPPQSGTPINEKDFFWPPNYSFHVGETHEFELATSKDQTVISLPHGNDDIQVIHKRRVEDDGLVKMVVMFQILSPHARATIKEAFGLQGVMLTSYTGGQYVKENTNCRSFGIVKCTRQVAPEELAQTVPQEVLVIKELARPLTGWMNFKPRRCFLREVGVVSKS